MAISLMGAPILSGTEFELEADWVVTALGFDPPPGPHSGGFSELAVNDWGGLVVDENQMTSLPGVFAGGDIVRGPTQVLTRVALSTSGGAKSDFLSFIFRI